MKTKREFLAASAIILFLFLFQLGSVLSAPIPGEAILKMTQNGKPEDLLNGSGAHVRDSIPGSQTFLIEIDSTGDIGAVISELEVDSLVIFVEPNYSVELPESFQMSISFPDDGPRPFLMGVEPVDFYEQVSISSLDVGPAQNLATGAGVKVALIDNGVDFTHPLLAPRLLSSGWDFMDNDSDPSYEPGLYEGHGTFVAGLIALIGSDCEILPLRAFNSDGIGNTYAIAEAIYHAVEQGADVINMSFGITEPNRIMAQAVNQAIMNGAAMVAASGNNGLNIESYPAAIPGVIAVSGIDETDYIAAFSNYGDYIDICAPSVNLYSALAGENEWGTWSGTSFAAPIVSAVCALVKEINPDYSTFIMQDHIRQSASVEFDWGILLAPDAIYGYGKVNAYDAVTGQFQTSQTKSGDLDGNGEVNINDVIRLIDYVFGQGPPPVAPGNPDMNCDGIVDGFDIEYFMNRVFHHGPRCGRCD